MDIARIVKRFMLSLVWPVLLMGVTVYFGWYGLNGARGQKAVPQRQQWLKQAQSELAATQAAHDALEQRVASLKAEHIDPDMLDERSRAVLGLSQPGEIVVQYPKGQALN